MDDRDLDIDVEQLAPLARHGGSDGSAHLVQFYESDAFLLDVTTQFLAAALRARDAAVVIATPSHHAGLEERLRSQRLDLLEARNQGRYVALDAAETLSAIMDGSMPDEGRFRDVVGAVIRKAGAGGRRVRAFGEMVALLCTQQNPDAAVRLEELWNRLAAEIPFRLLCAYPISAFRGEHESARFWNVCAEHAYVIPAESYTTLPSATERLRSIAELQQKASALEIERKKRELAEETQPWLAAIVESSDDAIVGKRLDGTVISWNRGAEQLFGYEAAEMIGQPISRLMPPDRRDDFRKILARIRRGERVDHIETVRVRKDGRRIQVSLTVSPVRDASGRIIGASKIARDITGRKQAETEREELLALTERARAEAEEANRAKDEFLAMLAHELRNPLAAVRNAVVAAKLDDRQRDRALDIARRQTDQLARLVDDLLDVSRITKGRILLRKTCVHLAEIIERAVESTRSAIEDHGQTLSVSLPAEDIRVEGDPTRLEQILVNLLGNAAKYTGRGGRIELIAERHGAEAMLRVRDNGIGIAPEMLTRIFDLFVQAGRGLDRGQGGLGIGLTLVRSLVALHGGRVEARSEGIGKGAEFAVRLPALPGTADEDARGATPIDTTPQTPARILIVEDNPDAAESLAMLLELLGHQVRVVRDGLAALDVAPANPPDVMLVDIGLPGMDGYEVARRVRKHPALGRVVLVALTGYGREEDRREALKAGFDYHLVKPIDPSALEGLVGHLGKDEPPRREPPTLH